MRKVLSIFITSTLLIIIFSGSDCNQTTTNPNSNTNCPDNNSWDCATKIQLGIAAQDNLPTNDAVAYFEFTTGQDGVIEVSVSNVPTNLNLNVEVYDNSGNWVCSSSNTGTGESVYLLKGHKKGTFKIKIYDRDHNASSSDKFTLLVTEDISDPYESNDQMSDAKVIALNSNLQAKFRPNDDVDYYQFTTPQDGVIEINVTNVPNNINVYSVLYDNNGSIIFSTYNNGLGQSIYMAKSRKAGLHYLRIHDQDNDASSSNFYNFSTNLDVADVYEYNNDLQSAKQISLNTNIQAKIKPIDDLDFFQIILTTQGNITVNVNNVPSNINMNVYVLDNNGWIIGSSTNTGLGQSVTLQVNNLNSGTYYVELEDRNHDAFNNSFYQLTVNH